jgi:hypothetical protein
MRASAPEFLRTSPPRIPRPDPPPSALLDVTAPYAVLRDEPEASGEVRAMLESAELEVLAQPRSSVPPPLPARATVRDSLRDLAFFETAVEGASFCLVTALRALPSLAGMALLRDPERGGYVVVYARGPRACAVVRSRVAERDPILEMARTRGAPLSVEYGDSLAPPERHASLGDPWRAVVAPVLVRDECIGALELIDPLEGGRLGAVERATLAAIAQRLASFVFERGLVVCNAFAPEQVGLD